MATETVYVDGIAQWAKLFERNRDQGSYHEATNGITSVDIYLDQEEWAKLEAAGCRLRPKVTEDGLMVKLRRPWEHPTIEEFGGIPQVVDADGADWDDGVTIGNGSKVQAAVSIYDTQMGKGTRLEGIKVLEHVEYVDPDAEPYTPKLPF